MICFDANILIYLANGTIDPLQFSGHKLFISQIAKIESLGYHNIKVGEEIQIDRMVSSAILVDINSEIADKAVKLRQLKKMGLGDAIIAATAIVNNATLWTANTKDFEGVEDLKLHNPVQERT